VRLTSPVDSIFASVRHPGDTCKTPLTILSAFRLSVALALAFRMETKNRRIQCIHWAAVVSQTTKAADYPVSTEAD